jgi:hypothetical protein
MPLTECSTATCRGSVKVTLEYDEGVFLCTICLQKAVLEMLKKGHHKDEETTK